MSVLGSLVPLRSCSLSLRRAFSGPPRRWCASLRNLAARCKPGRLRRAARAKPQFRHSGVAGLDLDLGRGVPNGSGSRLRSRGVGVRKPEGWRGYERFRAAQDRAPQRADVQCAARGAWPHRHSHRHRSGHELGARLGSGRGRSPIRLRSRPADDLDLAAAADRIARSREYRSVGAAAGPDDSRIGHTRRRREAVDAAHLRLPAWFVDPCAAQQRLAGRVRAADRAPVRLGEVPSVHGRHGDLQRACALGERADGFLAAHRRVGGRFRSHGRGDPLHVSARSAARPLGPARPARDRNRSRPRACAACSPTGAR